LGPLHSLSGYCYNDLGNIYAKLGKWSKAEEHYKLSQKIILITFGEDHPSMGMNHYNIGRAALKQGHIAKGLAEIITAYMTARSYFGEDKVKTLKVKAQIFGVLQTNDADQYEETCAILRKLLVGQQDVLDHFNIPPEKKKLEPVQVIKSTEPEPVQQPVIQSAPKPEPWRPRAVAFIPKEETAQPRTASIFELYVQSIRPQQTNGDPLESSDEECAKKEEMESSDEDEMGGFDLFM